MTEQEFIKKWDANVMGEYWRQNIDRLFWARSYGMPTPELVEMSTDFLMVGKLPRSSSSEVLAHNILKEHNENYRCYGLAGLYQSPKGKK